MRHSSPLGPSEMLGPQLLIHRYAFHWILRCKRAASDEKTRVSLERVTRDAAPEQMQQIEIAVLNMHACAAQLDHFTAQWFIRREIKLALAVIADVRCSANAGLQSICANDFICRDVFDDQVVANVVEKIDVEPGEMRFHQALVQFEVKNLKPQPLGATHLFRVLRQAHRVLWPPG